MLRTRRIIRFIVGATTEPARLGSAGRPAYAEPVSELWGALDTRPDGLTDEEAAARRPPETVRHERSRTLLVLEEVAESVVEPLQLLLVVVGVLSLIFGELRDAIAIFVVVGIVAAVEAISRSARSARSAHCAISVRRALGCAATGPCGPWRPPRSWPATCSCWTPAIWSPPTLG